MLQCLVDRWRERMCDVLWAAYAEGCKVEGVEIGHAIRRGDDGKGVVRYIECRRYERRRGKCARYGAARYTVWSQGEMEGGW